MARRLNLVCRIKLRSGKRECLKIALRRPAALSQARLAVVLVPHVHLDKKQQVGETQLKPKYDGQLLF